MGLMKSSTATIPPGPKDLDREFKVPVHIVPFMRSVDTDKPGSLRQVGKHVRRAATSG